MIIFGFDGVIADLLSLCRDGCQFVAGEQGKHRPLADNPFLDLNPVTFEALGEKLGLNGD